MEVRVQLRDFFLLFFGKRKNTLLSEDDEPERWKGSLRGRRSRPSPKSITPAKMELAGRPGEEVRKGPEDGNTEGR